MGILKSCEYVNTGGGCYVMFGNVETGEVDNPNGAWFAMSVDADVEPIVQFYATKEDAYNCDAETGFIREVRESDGEEWFGDFLIDCFYYAVVNGKGMAQKIAQIDAEKYCGLRYDI